MTKCVISPSILAADLSNLGSEIKHVVKAGADAIHIDVMDGHFVPNITFGPGMVEALRPHTQVPFDVHLMIAPVDILLKDFISAGADIITIHPEAGPHLHRSLQTIRNSGKKAGIALNPATPETLLQDLIDDIDLILVMTVNPGFGGQKFIPSMLDKISRIHKMIEGKNISLQVDGGITAQTAPHVIKAGADNLVAGTAIFKQSDYSSAISSLRS